MTVVHVLNGPNLNLLGTREPAHYGHETLADLEARCHRAGRLLGVEVDFRQSNHEGDLVTWLQEAGAVVHQGAGRGVVLNPGGYTHTSVAIADAITGAQVPVVEVHLSNVHAREELRRHSFVSPVARGTILGLGAAGYELALRWLALE